MKDNRFKNMNEELKYYFKLYEERFGKKAFIQVPGGTPEKTLTLIKKSLKEDKDLLSETTVLKDKNIIY